MSDFTKNEQIGATATHEAKHAIDPNSRAGSGITRNVAEKLPNKNENIFYNQLRPMQPIQSIQPNTVKP